MSMSQSQPCPSFWLLLTLKLPLQPKIHLGEHRCTFISIDESLISVYDADSSICFQIFGSRICVNLQGWRHRGGPGSWTICWHLLCTRTSLASCPSLQVLRIVNLSFWINLGSCRLTLASGIWTCRHNPCRHIIHCSWDASSQATNPWSCGEPMWMWYFF